MVKEYRGLAIADYFIEKALDEKIPITNMTVLKMIYFAHGLAYPQLGRKIIKDPFFKWQWGPVEKNTYEAFKSYGENPIRALSGETSAELEEIKHDDDLSKFLNSLMPLTKISPFVLSEKS